MLNMTHLRQKLGQIHGKAGKLKQEINEVQQREEIVVTPIPKQQGKILKKSRSFQGSIQSKNGTLQSDQLTNQQADENVTGLFIDAFTSTLQLLIGKPLALASDLEKCELFDKLDKRQKQGFWMRVGTLMGKTNQLAGVMYQNYKRKAKRAADLEKVKETDRQNLKQEMFVNAFTQQLELLTQAPLAESSDLEKCNLFDSLEKQNKTAFWTRTGARIGMENWQVREMYHNFKKKLARQQKQLQHSFDQFESKAPQPQKLEAKEEYPAKTLQQSDDEQQHNGFRAVFDLKFLKTQQNLIPMQSQSQNVQTRKLAVFRDVFTNQLHQVTGTLTLNDLSKCQQFDNLTLKQRKEFWRVVGEKSNGVINQSYYCWFRNTAKKAIIDQKPENGIVEFGVSVNFESEKEQKSPKPVRQKSNYEQTKQQRSEYHAEIYNIDPHGRPVCSQSIEPKTTDDSVPKCSLSSDTLTAERQNQLFLQAFMVQLRQLTQDKVDDMNDLEKCTIFDSVRCKQRIWRQISEQMGLTYHEVQSLYRNFRKKTLYHKTKQTIEKAHQQTTLQIGTQQQLFASQFAFQLSSMKGKVMQNVSHLEKCAVFDELKREQRAELLAKVGVLMILKADEVNQLYKQFKKNVQ